MNKHAIIHANKKAYNADIALFRAVLSQTTPKYLPNPQKIKGTLRKLKDRLNHCNSNQISYCKPLTNG